MQHTELDVADTRYPLCVDLDGTLVRTDLLLESALALLKRNPLYLFVFPLWLIGGRAHFKQEVARRVKLDISSLPWDPRVVELLGTERGRRPLVLCTASDRVLAGAVAREFGCFDHVMASDGFCNLSGRRKAGALVASFGEKGFDYAGNESRDFAVWKHARQAYVVNANAGIPERVGRIAAVARVFPRPRAGLRAWLRALRLHQWLKNLLVFMPLLAAHELFQPVMALRALAAFLIFGICASAVYVLNDLLDLGADRRHSRKRKRPFASGLLTIQHGLVVNVTLTVAAFAGAMLISRSFAVVLLGYWCLTNAYSLKLKRVVALDVVMLAGLYTVRILAGAAATYIAPSFWMLAFSMFMFLSLAILKRYAELVGLKQNGLLAATGRGYHIDDLPLLASLGAASGLLAVLVLALYIQGGNSAEMYHRPEILWFLCPLLLYWILRVWFVAHRGVMDDDPVVFAATDWVSRAIVALCALVVIAAL